ncbi:restriction endonuclease [Aerococcaceae bacterium DSM 111022]|nr:restriction endonuclease [Aerococcaceae bacterium DSM 111022]
MNYLPYDETNPVSIYNYSQDIVGKTFADILSENITDEDDYETEYARYNNPRGKGSLGELVEKYYFYLEINNESRPDFDLANVELKVTPYEQNKNGSYRAGERLILGMIPNSAPVPDNFYGSKLYKKIHTILLILYLRNRDIDRIENVIKYTQLVSLESDILKEDFEIILSDYEIITDKIKAGLAHELSESDTMYLGAATKGATAKKSLQPQYYNPDIPAKRRAFSLKQGYMTAFINKHVFNNTQTYDSIVDHSVSIDEFQQIVKAKILKYKGWASKDLFSEFNISSKAKSKYAMLVYAMLGIKSNRAEEFEKSNTQIKTIRLSENNNLKEHMSFPAINLIEFAGTDWEDSVIYETFSETRFFFIVFQEQSDDYYLKDAIFWNMPQNDLDELAYEDWQKYVDEINRGVDFVVTPSRTRNSLPKPSQTSVIHLRPKAKKSAHRIQGKIYGNIERDADLLPNGDMMTKQSFWLNKEYILTEIINYY